MTAKIAYSGSRWTARLDLAAGEAELLVLPEAGPFTLAIQPPSGAGADVLVEFSCSSIADIEAGQGLFVPAVGLGDADGTEVGGPGYVNSPVLDYVPSTLTAVRLTASMAGARVEIAQ